MQQRADKAGEQLARTLLARVHGNRPVTLIGFGMGARVILKCLLALSEAPSGQGVVETACLMGTPYPADALEWAKASAVCSYRLVNAYNSRDWLLGLAYRATSANISGIAGLREVDAINGSEAVLTNVDLTTYLSPSHFEYRDKLSVLVQALGAHTGVVDLTLIEPDNGIDRLIQSVPKLPQVSMPEVSSVSLQEKAARTFESMRFWKSKDDAEVLDRAASQYGVMSISEACLEPDDAEVAAIFQGRADGEALMADGSHIPPRPHSR